MNEISVRLKCVKEGNKLRVRIISPGYNPRANCQFPRAIRIEGREYIVPAADIAFSNTRGKFFYRVKRKNVVEVNSISTTIVKSVNLTDFKIFGDEHDSDCCICLDEQKDSAFFPCGHYYCCGTCANTLLIKKMACPICRAKITQLVKKEEFQ